MAEEKEVPPGWKTIQLDIERVQKECDFEKTFLELWKMHLATARETSLPFLVALAEKGVKNSEDSLAKCEAETVELKKKVPGMIKKWEEYWKRPFPLPELKKKVEEW